MGHNPHRDPRQAASAGALADPRRAALADTPTRVCSSGPPVGGCPACREMVALLRRQNRLLEELLEAMGVRP